MIQILDYIKELFEVKNQILRKNYTISCEIYFRLYDEIPFDNSNKYSYALAIYKSRVKNYTSNEQLAVMLI